MGINSYITHRMFVAALSHEKDSQDKYSRPDTAEKAGDPFSATNHWEAQMNALARAKNIARTWPTARVAGA